jgi:hypothetical protein
MGQKHWAIVCALVCIVATSPCLAAQPAEDPFGDGPSEQQAPDLFDETTAVEAATEVVKPAARPTTAIYNPNEATRRIEAVLDQPLREPLDFTEQPLRDVAQILSETYDIPIQFDVPALDAVAASPDIEVSVQIANIALRSALDLMLNSAGGEELTYIVDDEVLLITTQEEAESRLEVKVYRVDDLQRPIPEPQGASAWADFDPLIDVIVACVEPRSWRENGTGSGEVRPHGRDLLIVTQTSRVHEQIADLLAEMRQQRAAAQKDEANEQSVKAEQPTTRGILIMDDIAAASPEVRDQLAQLLIRSVDWNSEGASLAEDDKFLEFISNRIIVRHLPRVVAQVEETALAMGISLAYQNQLRRGGGFGGGGADARKQGGGGRGGGLF